MRRSPPPCSGSARGSPTTTLTWRWSAAGATAGGRSFGDFYSRYVDGREPFPWETVAPLAGIRLVADTTRDARLGLSALAEGKRVLVSSVQAGSAAAAGGVEPGDEL